MKFVEDVKYIFRDKGARAWSNQELKKFSDLFSGDIVNVSGWQDKDKEGKRYTDYFLNKKSYTITNYKGEKGVSGLTNEIYLDLEQPLPQNLEGKFDVVFNHTTLEHVFDIFTAFKNLCLLSKNIVILVVPFIEGVHELQGSFGDFWRPTHLAIEKLFESNGFSVLYGSSRAIPPVYHFFVASRNPGKWKKNFIEYSRENINKGDRIKIFLLHLIKYLTLPFRKPIFFLKYFFRRKDI
jgi:hypothetical protein